MTAIVVRSTLVGSVVLLAIAAAPAAAQRPAAVGLGLGASVESTPAGVRAVAVPVSIELSAAVAAPLWWRATATFASLRLDDARGDGHSFALRTGPAVERCWDGTLCVGAGVDLGWGHRRFALGPDAAALTVDGLDAEARLSTSLAVDRRRKVFLAGHAAVAARYAVTTSAAVPTMTSSLDLGTSLTIALVVHN